MRFKYAFLIVGVLLNIQFIPEDTVKAGSVDISANSVAAERKPAQTTTQIIVDRIEGDSAVVELPDMTMVDVPLSLLPGAKEGDVYRIFKDEAESNKRKNRIQELFDRLTELPKPSGAPKAITECNVFVTRLMWIIFAALALVILLLCRITYAKRKPELNE